MTDQTQRSSRLSSLQILAYAAPGAGSYFFYMPMWSILPGIYAKYFGLTLTSVAAVVLLVRLFDGFADCAVGYISDRHRANGGARKTWAVLGGLGIVAACYFLFSPPNPTTTTYYLIFSLLYFFCFATAEIPHLTWGSELTLNYQERARIYAARNVLTKLGIAAFYALPLLPIFGSPEYTPEVLTVAVYVGAALTLIGIALAIFKAPNGIAMPTQHRDSVALLLRSIFGNKPLLIYFSAVACGATCYGMWFALSYIYLDSYLHHGEHVALILLFATIAATATTPLWVWFIAKTSKTVAWATGLSIFALQLAITLFLTPESPLWLSFLVVLLANLCFTANDVAAVSSLGDIVDYAKMKFGIDRGATYFALLNLVFKIGLGVGGGVALGLAGLNGFNPSDATHSQGAIDGLKLGFVVLPFAFSAACVVLIVLNPIGTRRHRIIQRHLERRIRQQPQMADDTP